MATAGSRSLSEDYRCPDLKRPAAHHDISAALLAMAGHDLRQPLQVIIGAHDILARSIDGAAERAHLRLIEGAAQRLAGILGQLVETVRLQELASSDAHQPVSLRPILAELASEFAGPAEQNGVRLRIIPASAIVSSQPILLGSILRNLVRNAIDYTPRDGRVLVACRRRGADAHIEVRDSGIGISSEEMPKIFRAFHRGEATRPDGLGLGLFIVSRAAKLLGHRVQVRSAVGRGSCFVVVAKRPFGQGF